MEMSLQAVAVGLGFTVTEALVLSEQLPTDTTTEYVAFDVGVKMMEAEVAPLLHAYTAPPDAVNDAICPSQMVALVAAATGGGETVTVTVIALVQMLLDEDTVYVVVVLGETLIKAEELPLLQE